MLDLGLKNRMMHQDGGRFGLCACPTLSQPRSALGAVKVRTIWSFVSGVSPVSPNLKLIPNMKRKDDLAGISCRCAPFAGTAGTGAKVARISAETTRARHT